MKNEIKEAAVVTKDTVSAENAVAKFEVGVTYWCYGVDGCKTEYKVTARTAKMLTFENEFGRSFNRKIQTDKTTEYFKPTSGLYWVHANNIVSEETLAIRMMARRLYHVLSDGLTFYEEQLITYKHYEAAYHRLNEMYQAVLKGDKIAEQLIESGDITAEDIREHELKGLVAGFQFSQESYKAQDFDYEVAGLLISGGVDIKRGVDYELETCKDLQYFSLTRSALQKMIRAYLNEDATDLYAASFLMSEEEDDGSNDDADEEINRMLCTNETKIAELSEKAALLEAEIHNRKLIEAMTESLVTTEAFNASIQAEERAAIMEREVEPVMFEIGRFSGEDTAVKEVPASAKFEVGKIYYGKISSVYVEVKVVKRTAKFVTVVDYSEDYEYIDYDEAERHRIQIDNKGELIEFNDDFGVPYYVRANHSEPPKKYKDKYGQEGYYFEDDAWIPKEVTAAEDTAVDEVPVLDEETKLRGEYAELGSEIDALEDKLIELTGRRFDVGTKLSNVVRSKIEKTFQKAKEAIKKAAKDGASIELRVAKREGYYWIECGEDWEMLYCSVGYDGDITIEIGDKEVVRYKDKWEGAAAIEGLIAAIERGDENYTFPADDA